MDSAVIGFSVVFGVAHFLLIVVPLTTTLQSPISVKSKLIWCLFLLLLPLIGALVFHFRFRASLFHGKGYEISAAEERARSGTLSPDDHD